MQAEGAETLKKSLNSIVQEGSSAALGPARNLSIPGDHSGINSAEDTENSVEAFEADNYTYTNNVATGTGTKPLIKLTDVWKIYQMGEVEFAALKGIDLEIYERGISGSLGPAEVEKVH